ncbi:hypothetical protein P7K49_024620 [Saguinus oedipus]|uniref:Uncharacterized protein n=1 Tax=Saguinus oedipus TaxID=9490 RepID=A0ABQ9UQ13_SAGOE|nr:hypothetical protein P7K49_024620 [Saguinus oedipus]
MKCLREEFVGENWKLHKQNDQRGGTFPVPVRAEQQGEATLENSRAEGKMARLELGPRWVFRNPNINGYQGHEMGKEGTRDQSRREEPGTTGSVHVVSRYQGTRQKSLVVTQPGIQIPGTRQYSDVSANTTQAGAPKTRNCVKAARPAAVNNLGFCNSWRTPGAGRPNLTLDPTKQVYVSM